MHIFLAILIFIIALFVGYKWGKEVNKEDEWRKNINNEPPIFTLEHDAWEKTQKSWHDFIKSLESEDVDLIKKTKNSLINGVNESFNDKIAQLKITGKLP